MSRYDYLREPPEHERKACERVRHANAAVRREHAMRLHSLTRALQSVAIAARETFADSTLYAPGAGAVSADDFDAWTREVEASGYYQTDRVGEER